MPKPNQKIPVFAIDPGTTHSAFCVYYPDTHSIGDFGIFTNKDLRKILAASKDFEFTYAIEMIASYGMPVGKEVFETCVWIGRFREILNDRRVATVYRKDVKHYLCGSAKANDANIRQEILNRFPATGAGTKPQIGTKAQPGPLYGVSKDVWAAIAVALTYAGADTAQELYEKTA